MADEGRRERRGARHRDRIGALLVVVLACAAGVVAGSLATPKAWEHQSANTTPTSQGGP